MTQNQRQGDLVRSPDDRDPEGIGEYLDAAKDEFAGDQPPGGAYFALREMWYHLRASGEAKTHDLRTVGWQASDRVKTAYDGIGGFWGAAKHWFELLPGVHPPADNGRMWTFDLDREHERPSVPDDPDTLPPSYRSTVFEEIDDTTARKMYDHLIDEGSATSDELMELKAESRFDQPGLGRWTDRSDWFREVGRPALLELPGVARPKTLGGEWTFVGVSDDDLDEIHPDGVDPDVLEARLEKAPVGGRGEWEDKRRETVRELYEKIREDGTATRQSLTAKIDVQDVGYASADAFLNEVCVADGCLTNLPGIVKESDQFTFDSDKAREMCEGR